MEWIGLEPWQALLAGIVSAIVVTALANRSLVGYWNFLRAPRTSYEYVRWLGSLLAGFAALYYVPVLLVRWPETTGCTRAVDVWGSWFYVFAAVIIAAMLIIYVLNDINVDKVDWCAHCRRRG